MRKNHARRLASLYGRAGQGLAACLSKRWSKHRTPLLKAVAGLPSRPALVTIILSRQRVFA